MNDISTGLIPLKLN